MRMATQPMNLSTWQGMRTRDPRRLVLGSAEWGTPQGLVHPCDPPDGPELVAILARARSAGIGTIETARSYGPSEARIGEATAEGEGWRILTKLDREVQNPTGRGAEVLGIAETLEAVSRSLQESRRALGLDSLPVLMLHRFSHRHACGGRLWRMLLAEREAGRIGSLGVYTETPEEAWAALEDRDIEVLQVASSLLDLGLHRQGFFPRARELGRTIYVHGVFLHGIARLDPSVLPPSLAPLAPAIEIIHACATRFRVTPEALFLAFARELPGVYPIVGCETENRLATLLSDWSSEAIDAAAMTQLVESLPTLEANSADPMRQNIEEWAAGSDANQTGAASVATIPA